MGSAPRYAARVWDRDLSPGVAPDGFHMRCTSRIEAGNTWPLATAPRIVTISERLTNRDHCPCAKRVTWTRQYAMIRGWKALILLALRRMTRGRANWGKLAHEKAR
jgi:hypothetical protein